MTTIIRLAKPNERDFNAVLSLLAEHCVNGLVKPDRDKSISAAYHIVENGFCFLAECDNHVVGVLGLHEVELWYAKDRIICDLFFYIQPEHRHGEAAKGLIDAAKQLSQHIKIPVIISVTTTTKVRSPRTDLERIAVNMGFSPMGPILKVGGEVKDGTRR